MDLALRIAQPERLRRPLGDPKCEHVPRELPLGRRQERDPYDRTRPLRDYFRLLLCQETDSVGACQWGDHPHGSQLCKLRHPS